MQVDKKKDVVEKALRLRISFLWMLLLSVTTIVTIILYPNLQTRKYSYRIGDIAERDIKAPMDFLIKDVEATEQNRKIAADEALAVYDHDTQVATGLNAKLNQAFSGLRAVIADQQKRDAALAATSPAESPADGNIHENSENELAGKVTLHESIWKKKDEFQSILGIRVSDDAYSILEKEAFSVNIEKMISAIINKIMENGVVANKEVLLSEAEKEKPIVLRQVGSKTEKIVTNLKRFYGPDQAKAMVRIVGQQILKDVNYTLTNLIVDFCQRLIHPNIAENKYETQARRDKAASEVKLILHKVKAGEMLIREGERVSKVQLLRLRELEANTEKEQEHMVTNSVGTGMIVFCLLFLTYIIYLKGENRSSGEENRNLLFFSSILIVFCFIAKISAYFTEFLSFPISASFVYGMPMAAGGMTVCLFMGINLAIPLAMLLAICSAIIFNNRFDLFLYFFLGGSMAAYWIQDCRERHVFIKAGAKIGILNVILVTALDIYSMGELLGRTSMWDFGAKLLWDWAFAFSAGIMTGIITHGIVPLIEVTFDYMTNIKLLELANLDRPILKRLMLEAPGTYHHSVIVGSMVEAAASSIGANPLLSRVCGYYHDIGKINKPLYFIENQSGGRNRHDKLAPSMSSLILISHIKEGVEIAKENKIGRAIVDTIQQHHGTSLISFFYEKAKKLKGEDAVKIDDYRYPGPKPQTREAGLVMLADVIEAASRTLDNPTPARIQGHVQKFINKIFSDGQLDNCELTLKDLHNIAKSFNKILNGIYHHRIEYSDTSNAAATEKGKNGNTDRQPPKPPQDRPKPDNELSSSHLRRLGQS